MSKTSIYLLMIMWVLNANCNGFSWGQYSSKISNHPSSQNLKLLTHLKGCKYQICNHWDGYPEDDINKAMEKQHTVASLLSGVIFNVSADVMHMINRGKFSSFESEQLCQTESSVTLAPRLMLNVKNQIKVVVNTDLYRQTFTVEACRDFANPTKSQFKNTCSNLGYSCKQNRQNLPLLIYDVNSGIRFDTFTVPTVCKCCAG